MANALVTWDKERETTSLHRLIASLESRIEVLDQRIRPVQGTEGQTAQKHPYDARTLMSWAGGLLSVLELPRPPIRPDAPAPRRNAAPASLLGMVPIDGPLLLRACSTSGCSTATT